MSSKVIIAGSRGICDRDGVFNILNNCELNISEVVSGGASGVDDLGEQWGYWKEIPVKIFPANWSKYGKSAGYRRNVDMAKYADALIAIWDDVSKGTKHMLDIAEKEGLLILRYSEEDL